MTRLTKKNNRLGSWTQLADDYLPAHNIKHKQCVNKLGELEDIEDELGIDLIVLSKAIKEGFYSTYFNDYVKPSSIVWFPHMKPFMEIKVNVLERLIFLKDYGKTWALTKEELENESNINVN